MLRIGSRSVLLAVLLTTAGCGAAVPAASTATQPASLEATGVAPTADLVGPAPSPTMVTLAPTAVTSPVATVAATVALPPLNVTAEGSGGGAAEGPAGGAEGIVSAFRDAGIPVEQVAIYTSETDPNKRLGRPNQYVSKVSWKDRRLNSEAEPGTTSGGTVEVFADEADLKAFKDYVDAATASSPMLTEYSYTNGTALLRLAGDLTPAQAKEYEDAFAAVR